MSLEDTRDMRDPQILGTKLLQYRNSKNSKRGLSWIYDSRLGGVFEALPNYDPKSSTVEETIAKYTAELEQRAMLGDRNAISMLTTGQPGDSDE